MGLRAVISALIFCLASLSTSGANVFDRKDVEQLKSVLEQLGQTHRDLIAARGSLVATEPSSRLQAECLSDMIYEFTLVRSEFGALKQFIFVSSAMQESGDEAVVIGVIKIEADSLIGLINQFRSKINEVSNICYRNNLVATKAQQLLSIYGDMTSMTKAILRRL